MCRQQEEEIRETVAETGIINQTIAEKDEEMAELKEQAAEQNLAKQNQAAAASRAGVSKDKAAPGAGDSPRSNMSSPWATDVRLFFLQSPSFHALPAVFPNKGSATHRIPNVPTSTGVATHRFTKWHKVSPRMSSDCVLECWECSVG